MKTAIELQQRELQLERAMPQCSRGAMTDEPDDPTVEHDDLNDMEFTLDFSAQALRCSLADFASFGSAGLQPKK